MSHPTCADFGVRATHGFFGPRIRSRIQSDVDHAVIYLGNGQILEATPSSGRVNTRDLRPGESGKFTWATLDLTPEQRRNICAGAHDAAQRRRRYSTALALAAWADQTGHTRARQMLIRAAVPSGATCGTIIAELYRAAGVDLLPGRPSLLVTAGDLHRVILRTPRRR